MARITVEDCLEHVANRFCLVRLASKRAKQLLSGAPAVSDFKENREIVGALREIADGKVTFATKEKSEVLPAESSTELPSPEKEKSAVVPTPATGEGTRAEASP